jgi:hypothetical protein
VRFYAFLAVLITDSDLEPVILTKFLNFNVWHKSWKGPTRQDLKGYRLTRLDWPESGIVG